MPFAQRSAGPQKVGFKGNRHGKGQPAAVENKSQTRLNTFPQNVYLISAKYPDT